MIPIRQFPAGVATVVVATAFSTFALSSSARDKDQYGCETHPSPGIPPAPSFAKLDIMNANAVPLSALATWAASGDGPLPYSGSPVVLTNGKSRVREVAKLCNLTDVNFSDDSGRVIGIVKSYGTSQPQAGIADEETYLWLDRRGPNTSWRYVMIGLTSGVRYAIPATRMPAGSPWPSDCLNATPSRLICWQLKGTSTSFDRILVAAIQGGYFAAPNSYP